MVRFVMQHVLDQEIDVEGCERRMSTPPQPLARGQSIEAVSKPIALDQEPFDRLAALMRSDEIDETRIALGRIGLERRFITFEHRTNPTFEQMLNTQEVAHQFGERPLLRLDSPLQCSVAKAVGDAPYVAGMFTEPADQLLPDRGRHVRTRARGTRGANPA